MGWTSIARNMACGSVMDRHTYKHLSFREIANKDLHMPFSIGMPEETDPAGKDYFRGIPGFVDDFPPVTVITHVKREEGQLRVRGTTADCSPIKQVLVNGKRAVSLRGNFAEWEAVLDAREGTS